MPVRTRTSLGANDAKDAKDAEEQIEDLVQLHISRTKLVIRQIN